MSEPEPYKTKTVKQQVLIFKKTIHKTMKLLFKTFQNLKSFPFRCSKNAQQLPPSNPFFSTNRIPDKELDDFYRIWSEQWESKNNHNQEDQDRKKTGELEYEIGIQKNVERAKVEKGETFSQSSVNNGSSRSLAQKMKELEMTDMEDIDQVLDIEEVLHYYSQLNCPLYLDIVDTFFTDMYTEFALPQPTLSCNRSRRRLGPIKLCSS